MDTIDGVDVSIGTLVVGKAPRDSNALRGGGVEGEKLMLAITTHRLRLKRGFRACLDFVHAHDIVSPTITCQLTPHQKDEAPFWLISCDGIFGDPRFSSQNRVEIRCLGRFPAFRVDRAPPHRLAGQQLCGVLDAPYRELPGDTSFKIQIVD